MACVNKSGCYMGTYISVFPAEDEELPIFTQDSG